LTALYAIILVVWMCCTTWLWNCAVRVPYRIVFYF